MSSAAPTTAARPTSAAGPRLAPIHAATSAAGSAAAEAGSTIAVTVAVTPSLSHTSPSALPASPTSLSRSRRLSPKSRMGTRRGSTVSVAESDSGGFNGGGGAAYAASSRHSIAAADSVFAVPAAPCAACAERRLNRDASAASSLDSYLRLQNDQSSRGLEVVYGLKIELSRFIEELSDRFPCGGGSGGTSSSSSSFQALAAPTAGIVPGIPALPYRVVGHGGIEYWDDVRAGKIKLPANTEDVDDAGNNDGTTSSGGGTSAHHSRRGAAMDPFSTRLPSFAAPPPPLTPESVLPSYVLLNRLKLGVRQTLNAMEDGLDDMRTKLRASEQARTELQTQLDRAVAATRTSGGGAIVSVNPADFQSFDADTGTMVALSPMAAEAAGRDSFSFTQQPGSPSPSSGAATHRRDGSATRTRSRSRSRSRVQFATDEFVNTSVTQGAHLQPPSSAASPPNPSAHPTTRRDSTSSNASEPGGFASAAQTVFNRTPTGQNSVSNRITNQALAAAAAAKQSGVDSARDLSARSSSGSSSNMDSLSFRSLPSSGNVAREEALSAALSAAESSLVRWKARARSLADAAHLSDVAHSKELSALSQQLVASKLRVHDDAKVLTQRNVLLQLETIARRERQKQVAAQHEFFASAIKDYTKEIKQLFSTREQRLFVRKTNPPHPPQHQHQQQQLQIKDSSGSTNILVLHDSSTPKRGTTAPGSRKKSLASARTPGASTPALLEPPSAAAAVASAAESKEDPNSSASTALVRVNPILGVPGADGLYPSPASPLTQLERSSARTPAGARWLGKLLSPPATGSNLERDTLVVASSAPAEKPLESGPGLQGHLVAGADALALDLLLVLDALFLLEYAALSAHSLAHSRDLKFRTELETRRNRLEQQGTEDGLQGYLRGGGTGVTIANQTGLTSFGPNGEPITSGPGTAPQQQSDSASSHGVGINDTREFFDGAPSPAALAALIASIPSQSLGYLQALQKLFLTLWTRLPASVQSKFVKVKQQSAAKLGQGQGQSQTGAHAQSSDLPPPPPVDLLNPRLREAIQSQTVNGTPVGASSAAADGAPGSEDAATIAAAAAVSASSPAVVAASSAVSHASHRAALRLQFLVDDLRLAHTLGAGPPSANTVGEHRRRDNLRDEPQQQTLEQSTHDGGGAAGNTMAPVVGDKSMSSDGFTSKLVRLADAPTSASGKLALSVPQLSDSFAPDSGSPSLSSVSLYLSRLELILHKVQSMANFRGVIMQM